MSKGRAQTLFDELVRCYEQPCYSTQLYELSEHKALPVITAALKRERAEGELAGLREAAAVICEKKCATAYTRIHGPRHEHHEPLTHGFVRKWCCFARDIHDLIKEAEKQAGEKT